MQINIDCFIRNLETFDKLTTGFVVFFLYGRLQDLLSRACGRSLRSSSQTDRFSYFNFWKQCLAVRSLTAVSPSAWRIQRLDEAADKPTLRQTTLNELLWHRQVSSPLLEILILCVRKKTALVKCNAPSPPWLLSRHVTRSFAYQSSLLSTRRTKTTRTLLFTLYCNRNFTFLFRIDFSNKYGIYSLF